MSAARKLKLRSTPTMAEVLAVKQAERDAENARREERRAEYRAQEDAREETVRLATDRGEDVDRDGDRVRVLARDGLNWLRTRRGIPDSYFFAGLRFRGDLETAEGQGVLSCLNDSKGNGFGPGSGPTDAMLTARSEVDAALRALGTPLLKPYALHVAGEGRMLTDPVFGPDPKRSEQHYIPTVITLDILARHYGMVK